MHRKISRKGQESETLVTLGFIILAAFAIFWWASNYSHQLQIFTNINNDALQDNFDLINTELELMKGDFASSEMALRLSRPSAIVGFNADSKYIEYSRDGKERLKIHRPEVYCRTACLCLYISRDDWGDYEKRHKNAMCVEYDAKTEFYSREDPDDYNVGVHVQVESKDYESLVLYGEGFRTKAMYLEKQEYKGKSYVYIAELDPTEKRNEFE